MSDCRNSLPTHALTLHGPWAWAIVNGVKTVENREWATNHRGPIFVHAGRSFDSDVSARELLARWGAKPPPEFVRGMIIGTVDVVDVLPLAEYLRRFAWQPHLHEMAIGPWCWVLANPQPCEPVRHAGNFQLWPVRLPPERFRFLEPVPTTEPSKLIDLRGMFERLLTYYGPQKWWPAESPLEVILGLILVRNSQWPVAARVIDRLKSAGMMQIKQLQQLPDDQLLDFIRPVGRQNAKAALIRRFAKEIAEKWGGFLMPFLSRETQAVRDDLLVLPGIGPETADMILLYAANHPVCPVDDYTRRIFLRHGLTDEKSNSEILSRRILDVFGPDAPVLNELHALFVQTGRDFCLKSTPRCGECPLCPSLPQEC